MLSGCVINSMTRDEKEATERRIAKNWARFYEANAHGDALEMEVSRKFAQRDAEALEQVWDIQLDVLGIINGDYLDRSSDGPESLKLKTKGNRINEHVVARTVQDISPRVSGLSDLQKAAYLDGWNDAMEVVVKRVVNQSHWRSPVSIAEDATYYWKGYREFDRSFKDKALEYSSSTP